MKHGAVEIDHRVGRLIETRVQGILSLDDVVELRRELLTIVASAPGSFLSAIDVRRATNQGRNEIAQVLLQTFRDSNPKIERTGILIGADPLMPVQVEAMLLSIRHPGRRVFREVPQVVDFLGELATDDERSRLLAFLAEQDVMTHEP